MEEIGKNTNALLTEKTSKSAEGTKEMIRKYSEQNVYEALQERLKFIFEEFEVTKEGVGFVSAL